MQKEKACLYLIFLHLGLGFGQALDVRVGKASNLLTRPKQCT